MNKMTSATDLLDEAKQKEITERAQRAVRAFNRMSPQLSAFAKMLTGNSKVRVLSFAGTPCTNGDTIYMRPPIELGDTRSHPDRSKCSSRDYRDLLECKACRAHEDVIITLFHEVGHIVFESFQKVEDSDRQEIVLQALREAGAKPGGKRAEKITKIIEAARPDSYVAANAYISRFLPVIFNAIEDARVNIATYGARPGTYKMFRGQTIRVFEEGIQGNDGEYRRWNEAPRNAQVIVGLYCKAMGMDYSGWFIPEVEDALNDSEIVRLMAQVKTARNARDVYRVGFPILERLRGLGFCKAPEDIEEEEESGAGDPADEPSEDGTADPTESQDEDGNAPTDDEGEEPDEDGQAAPTPTTDDEAADESEATTGDADEGEETDDRTTTLEGDSGESSDQPDVDKEPSVVPTDDEDDDEAARQEQEQGEQEQEQEPQGQEGEQEQEQEPQGQEGEQEQEPQGQEGEQEPDDDDDDYLGPDASMEADDAAGDDTDAEVTGDAADGEDEDGTDSSPGDDEGDVDPENDNYGDEQAEDGDAFEESDDDGNPFEDDNNGAGGMTTEGPGTEAGTSPPRGPDFAEDGAGVYDDLEDEPEPQPTPEPEVDLERDGDVDEVEKALRRFGHHELPEDSDDEEEEVDPEVEEAEREEVDRAVAQADYFDTSSRNVFGVRIHRHERPYFMEDGVNLTEVLGYQQWDDWTFNYHGAQVIEPDDKALTGPLQKLRIAFTENRRAVYDRNRKSGRVDGRVLARRFAVQDPRLFQKKKEPGKRDYFVVIGIDISGSTTMGKHPNEALGRLGLIKSAALAQAELLHRLGIPFELWAHTAHYHSEAHFDMFDLDMFEIKLTNEPWNSAAKKRLTDLTSASGNLDGRTLEFYRKRCDQSLATERIIMYYTDGAMPAANRAEEKEILESECRTCKKKSITLMGVGVFTDSPTQYGMNTVQIDSMADLPKVVAHLANQLKK